VGNCTEITNSGDPFSLQDNTFTNCMRQAAKDRNGNFEPADCRYEEEESLLSRRWNSWGRNVGWDVFGVAILTISLLVM